MLGLLASLIGFALGIYGPILLYAAYFSILFLDCLFRYQDLRVAFFALYAVLVQFTAYGVGFLKSTILVNFSGKEPQEVFPQLFFKKG